MKKLCIIYNFDQLYRESIFRLIDKEWDCEWYFGNNKTDIKGLPKDALKTIHYVDNKSIIGPIVWQSGIGKLIRNKKFDGFLMLGEPMTLSTWWLMIQRKLFYRSKKIYLWSHGWYGREGFLKKWLKRAFFGLADGTFLYGNYAKDIAIQQGNNPEKLYVIHNSLNFDNQNLIRKSLSINNVYSSHFGNDYPTLIFIGRLTKIKRIDMIIEAMSLLKKDNYFVNLTLIGDGSEIDSLKELVRTKGLDKNVWFYGSCYDDTQNASLIYNADLCVAPGNVGLTAMHTMVFGTPVLTHDKYSMQMPEFEAISNGKTGAFFKYGDTESLALAIRQWFSQNYNRELIRTHCFNEIKASWQPHYQINILKDHLKL